MNFFIVGILLWTLIGVSVLLFLLGMMKKSWRFLLVSGLAFMLPSFFFYSAQGWVKFLSILPLLCFFLAYYFKRKG